MIFTVLATLSAALLLLLYQSLLLPVTPLLALDVTLFAAVLRFKLGDGERRLRELLLAQTAARAAGGERAEFSWKQVLVTLGHYVEAEAMALVRDLSTDESPQFVNGVLGALLREKETLGG